MPFQGVFYHSNYKKISTELIDKLTVIRIADFDSAIINREINDKMYYQLPILIEALSERLQKINFIRSDGVVAYKIAKKRFQAITNHHWYANKSHALRFAAYLLQYYTILCDEAFEPDTSFTSFKRFLIDHQDTFGVIEKNLFITEYLLIKIYHDLSTFNDVYQSDTNNIKAIEHNGLIATLSNGIDSLKSTIRSGLAENSDNIFLQYLHFIAYYSAAKLIEIQFKSQATTDSEPELQQKTKLQSVQLTEAKKILLKINNLLINNVDSGMAYKLGKQLLDDFPEKNINRLQRHIDDLLQENG